MKTKILLTAAIFLFLNLLESQAQIWEQTNGPYGVYVLSLALHPSGYIYAGVYSDGLFCSTNEGDSWFNIGFKGKSVMEVFVSPNGIIFITTNYDYYDELGNIITVEEPFRSTDNGLTWNLVNINFTSNWFTCWDSDNSGNIYLACWDNSAGGFKIFQSSDEGENWTYWTTHELSDPNDLLFYSSYTFLSDGSNGIYKLVNNSWVKSFPSQWGGLGTSCITKTSGGALLAGTQIPGQGVYRSLDNAENWERIYSGGIETTTVTSIIMDLNGNIFASTNNGIFKSTDEGQNWIQYGLENSWLMTMAFTNSEIPLTGDYFGIYRWNNGLQVWEDAKTGLYVNKTFSLAFNQSTNSFFATTTAGLFRSTNYGDDWESVLHAYWGYVDYNTFIKNVPLLFDTQSGTLFTKDNIGILYRSNDNGVTWDTSSFPFFANIMCFVSGLEAGEILGGGISYPDWGYSTFFYSSDYGETWSRTYLGGPEGPPVQCLVPIKSSNYLFAGTAGSGIYRSTDQGEVWRTFNVGLVNTKVQSMATNSSGDIFLGTHNGVFRSRDNGGNWTWIGLENDTVLALDINSVNYVFAGTKAGRVYKSTDDGETWTDFSSGLNLTAIRCLLIDDEDFAMVGTVYKGIFRTINSTVDIDINDSEIPTEFLLSQNYPNPFNPRTSIQYAVSSRQFVSLKVYDVLGNEIETLVSEEKPAGTYEITWYADQLPSGVYFYQIRAGEFIQTKKMLLLK